MVLMVLVVGHHQHRWWRIDGGVGGACYNGNGGGNNDYGFVTYWGGIYIGGGKHSSCVNYVFSTVSK